MQNKTKKRIWRAFATVMAAVCFQIPETGQAGRIGDRETNEYPMEAIIANPERLENEGVDLRGYAKFEKDGISLYKTEQDYVYDTKENAVWIPNRKGKEPAKEQLKIWGTLYDGQYAQIEAVIQRGEKESPYAAEAAYIINEFDEVWETVKELPKAERYNRQNEKEKAIRVSFYRLLGNPWRYDGKKVCVDVKHKQEGEMFLNDEDDIGSIMVTEDIYGEMIDFQAPVQGLMDEYKNRKEFANLEEQKLRDIVELPIYTKRVRMEMEMMFYMHEISVFGGDKEGVCLYYWPCNIKINEKDKSKWEEGMEEIYRYYKNKPNR